MLPSHRRASLRVVPASASSYPPPPRRTRLRAVVPTFASSTFYHRATSLRVITFDDFMSDALDGEEVLWSDAASNFISDALDAASCPARRPRAMPDGEEASTAKKRRRRRSIGERRRR